MSLLLFSLSITWLTSSMVSRVRILTDAPIEFGQISPDDWYQPAWIDEKRAEQGRLAMMRQHIIYAGMSHLILHLVGL